MNKRRTSLKDLAARLGVSIATVSRALRNSHEVGDEMKEKVQLLAKEMNYRPNPFAQSLRKEAPRIIGVVVPNLVTHYYAAVLDGIEDFAVKNGYSVISANSHELSATGNCISLSPLPTGLASERHWGKAEGGEKLGYFILSQSARLR